MFLQAIILGIVQGLTEFLPISSSAHLLLVPYFFNWQDPGLGFDVALHWGTLLAVILVFWKDYWRYTKAFFRTLYKKDSWTDHDSRLAWFLILASIPGAIFGLLFEKQAETVFRDPLVTVFTLAGFGLVLWLVDKKASHEEKLEGLTWLKALGIGVSQALAVIPGVSRSGATITAGLLTKLDREAATKFSFLLSGPIIFGAGLVALRHVGHIDAVLIVGLVSAFVSGIAAIKFLLKYVSTHSFDLFVWYRYILAFIVLLVIMFH
ncbi:MAG: undecaprenyl-diphosphatase UppP [Patescibacteria group bacterium]|nr:undecaprenyl-diphosphatase UppP [Patescibacteria group bacterium]